MAKTAGFSIFEGTISSGFSCINFLTASLKANLISEFIWTTEIPDAIAFVKSSSRNPEPPCSTSGISMVSFIWDTCGNSVAKRD